MSSIDVGAGMRSADIPDGFGHFPDEGTCSARRARGRLKKDGTMRQHWRYGWPRSRGNPPCGGSGEKPSILNESRVTRYLAEQRNATHHEMRMNAVDDPITVPKTTADITEAAVKSIVGWIGRRALPPTLPHTMPEYRTALALDLMVTRAA